MMGRLRGSNGEDLSSSRSAGRESSTGGDPVKRNKKTDPKANNTQDPSKNSTALELLRIILETGAINQNRRYCVYCKAAMAVPLELHRKECVWRRAWELLNDK
jgi:hypothetical protein